MLHAPAQVEADCKIEEPLEFARFRSGNVFVLCHLTKHRTQFFDPTCFVPYNQGAQAHTTKVKRYPKQVKCRGEVESFVTFFCVVPTK